MFHCSQKHFALHSNTLSFGIIWNTEKMCILSAWTYFQIYRLIKCLQPHVPCFTLIGFATWGSEVNSVLREWRLKFFLPVLSFWACFIPLAFFLCEPLEGCPLAFWSCIKEEMGEKKHYWFCVLSDSNTEDRKTHKELGVGSGAAPSLVCEPEGDGRNVKEVEGEEEH